MFRYLLLVGCAFVVPTMTMAQQLPSNPSIVSDQRGDDIVVTARSLSDTARDLATCLARQCPPDEDMAATLAHAENQFVAGNYADARRTLSASLGRNRRVGPQFPLQLSRVYRAYARVSANLGEARAYQLATLDLRQTLARAFPATDGRVLSARIEVADSRARLGYVNEARRMYANVAEDAAQAGNRRIAAFSLLRLAVANYPSHIEQRQAELVRRSMADLTAISEDAVHVGADLALLADVILARIDRDRGDMRRTDALAQRAAASGTHRPLLLSGEPVRLSDADREDFSAVNNDVLPATGGPDFHSHNVLAQMQTVSTGRRWIDVGFQVNLDGTIGDLEILRHRGDLNWARAVERSIRSRRYAPFVRDAGATVGGFYVVERYTLTSNWRTDCTGSHQRCRAQRLIVERTDMTTADSG